ncbi:hypothetical protein [Nocardioides speluncae]|uniref:hypothetical protein n=1 Tax=Nocardioides speluncae TaxID=2670337 RepID=UPI000D6942DD|nr:hypothetical protein [Nocardioides speluncae]
MKSLVLSAAAVALAGQLLIAPTADAADPRIGVINDRGTAQADGKYRTPLTISGSGFQAVRGGFGGVYVMFGWVDDPAGDSWKPSRGGVTGKDYRYLPDSESANNQGYLRFVAFPGSSTAAEANAVMSASGGFSVDLTVPGPVFRSVDRAGKVSDIDCREVTCGVITIGAHGVKNPRNETFTPVRFGNVYDAPPAPTPSETPAPGAEPTRPSGEPAEEAAPGTTTGSPPTTRRGKPAVVTDRTTAKAGHALAFTGTGFQPGEQVLAVLDDGVAALGPLVAGLSGEVAGILRLPADLPVGTHELRLTGAASGVKVLERFPVQAATTEASTSSADAEFDDERDWPLSALFLGAAGLVFVVALVAAVLRVARSRRRPALLGGH